MRNKRKLTYKAYLVAVAIMTATACNVCLWHIAMSDDIDTDNSYIENDESFVGWVSPDEVEFSLDGVECPYPCSVATLFDNGWRIAGVSDEVVTSEEYIEKISKVKRIELELHKQMNSDGSSIEKIKVQLSTNDKSINSIEDLSILGIKVLDDSTHDVSFGLSRGNIGLDDDVSISDVISTLGEPVSISEDESRLEYIISKPVGSVLATEPREIYLIINFDGGYVADVEIRVNGDE